LGAELHVIEADVDGDHRLDRGRLADAAARRDGHDGRVLPVERDATANETMASKPTALSLMPTLDTTRAPGTARSGVDGAHAQALPRSPMPSYFIGLLARGAALHGARLGLLAGRKP
jgi:hypothetical protein